MELDKEIERFENNAEFERRNGNLQGCLDFRQLAEWLRELKALRIAVYKLSRIPYGEHLTYKADDVWELFGTYFADFEEEVMDYEEVNADDT